MASRLSLLLAISCVVIAVNSAAIDSSNSVLTETPRISSSEDMLSEIISNCFSANAMHCVKEKVLAYLDTVAGLRQDQARSFEEANIDKTILDRVGRILANNEIRVQLPQTLFQNTIVSYRSDRGVDFELPKEEARGDLLKKKLLLPVLLLLKLKFKALLPIFVALIGLKAMKALILSKLAITLVLGFLIYQLVQKTGLGMKMAMMPMTPAMPPADSYGAPAPTTPASSYEASWEPSGGPYSRVWEPSSGSSAQNLAYSAYYPGSSSSGSSSSVSSSGSSSSSSSSSSPSSSYSTY